ncbi:MAG: thioredoxin family protein [Burkholderiales bacterium]
MFLKDLFKYITRALWLLILACTLAALPVHAEPLPLATDLAEAARMAREQRVPVLIAFTLKTCPYCNTARRDYWEPMHTSEKWRGKAIMLELQLDGVQPLRDFAGNATTARDFARRFTVRSVPTVIVFNDSGKPTTTPLVGLSSGDFYSLYLEQAVESGLIDMRYPQK